MMGMVSSSKFPVWRCRNSKMETKNMKLLPNSRSENTTEFATSQPKQVRTAEESAVCLQAEGILKRELLTNTIVRLIDIDLAPC